MKRKVLLILLSIAITGAAAYYYIDTVFLPIQFKQYITKKATEYLNRDVSIGTVDIIPLRGLVIKDVSVARRKNADGYLFKSSKITFNILLVPIFQKKAVIIPFIKISNPEVTLIRNKKGIWNIDDLMRKNPSSGNKPLPPVLLRKLIIEKGSADITDRSSKRDFKEQISNINLQAMLSLNKGIRFLAQAHLAESGSDIKLKGNHTLISKKLTSQISATNIDIPRYLSFIDPEHLQFRVNKGTLQSADLTANYQNGNLQLMGNLRIDDADISVGETKQMTGSFDINNLDFTWDKSDWDLKGQFSFNHLHLKGGSGREFQGNGVANIESLMINGPMISSTGNVTVEGAYLKFNDTQYIKGHLTANNASLSNTTDAVQLSGDILIDNTVITVDDDIALKSNVSAEKAQLIWSMPGADGKRHLTATGILSLKAAMLTLGEGQSLHGNITAPKSKLTFDGNTLTVEAQGQIMDNEILLADNISFDGDPHFNTVVAYDFNSSDPLDFKTTVHFNKSNLKGMPSIGTLSNIEGTLTATARTAETNELTFIARNTPIKLSGTLSSYSDPHLDAQVFLENIVLEEWLDLAPKVTSLLKGTASGRSTMKVHYDGPLKKSNEAKIAVEAEVSDALISSQRLKSDITNISGQINYKNNFLSWKNLIGNYLSRTYTLDGELNDFSRPVIDTTIIAEQLTVDTQIKLLNQAFQLTKLKGAYFNTNFDLKGDVHLSADADPDIDLRGYLNLNLGDLPVFAPRFKDDLSGLKLSGSVAGEGLFMGKIKDWRNWKVVFDGTSDLIQLDKLPFKNVSVQFAQRDDAINKYNVTATLYEGLLTLASSADLRGPDVPFQADINLQNLKMENAHKGKNKSKGFGGLLSATAQLTGEGKKFRQLTGEGSFDLIDGKIWQWDILDGMSKIMLIPEFQTLSFNEAHGSFSIHDERVFTDNTQLIGDSAKLDVVGWVDFDTYLNFNIKPTFSEIAILKSGSARKKSTSIFTQTDGYINIRLTGTLDKPKYDIEKFPIKLMEKTIGGTTGTIKAVIGDIVDEIF